VQSGLPQPGLVISAIHELGLAVPQFSQDRSLQLVG
jgi:hypothetical protein